MNTKPWRWWGALLVPTLATVMAVGLFGGCGKARPFVKGSLLGDAVGGSRTDGADIGTIFPVTQVITGVGGASIPGWAVGDHPFNTAPVDFNDPTQNRHVPVSFSFTYPPNNYALAEAHLVIDTLRDGSDTEGIFVDGVLTGTPPTTMVNTASPYLTHKHYTGNPDTNPVNNYFMDWSLTHYKQLTRNTFDLDLAQLLLPTAITPYDVVSDGFLPVMTADDSPVYQAYLVLKGYTISKTSLNCSITSPFSFENVYLHNDGNSIGQSAFSGTVEFPFDSWSSVVAPFKSIEFYFDGQLPQVDIGNITLANSILSFEVKRTGTDAAIVINGVGISTSDFNRTTATSVVEQWNDSAATQAYWDSVVATIPTDGTATVINLNLNSLLGSGKVKELVAQGKLNFAVGGSFTGVNASNLTANRASGAPVSGPELSLNGTYVNQVCEVPDNASSPLQGGTPAPTDPGDVTDPLVISVQAVEITSTSAAIQWLTDEGADTQVDYGIGAPTTSSPLDATARIFHRVELTGLTPYKYYMYQVKSKDGNGNETIYNTKAFRTLR